MATAPGSSSLPLLLSRGHLLVDLVLVLFLSRIPSALATGCYKADGSASHADEWPCDPTADTSVCCGSADYCLGSLACLDTGTDNRISLQGCTNSSWPEACNPICPGTTADGYIYLQLCSSDSGASEVCCGTDYSCCNGTRVVSMDIFTAISRAPGVTSTASSTTATDTASASAAGTGTGSTSVVGSTAVTSTTSASTSAALNSSTNSSGNNAKSLAIGLGVGIPMGLAFIGALVFLGLQLRKRNATAAAAAAAAQAQAQAPLMSMQTPSQPPAQLYQHRGAGNWQHGQGLGEGIAVGAQEMDGHGKASEVLGEGFAHEVPG